MNNACVCIIMKKKQMHVYSWMQRIWIYPAPIRKTVVLCVSSSHHPFSCLYAHGGDQG